MRSVPQLPADIVGGSLSSLPILSSPDFLDLAWLVHLLSAVVGDVPSVGISQLVLNCNIEQKSSTVIRYHQLFWSEQT